MVFVINELDSTITIYDYIKAIGALQPVQITSTLPQNFTGNSRATEIAITDDWRFIYASNHGSDLW